MRSMTLNLIPDYSAKRFFRVSQYDHGYTVSATIYKGVDEYTIPDGYTVTVEGRKPDGTGYQYAATFNGSVVTFPVESQMTVLAGQHEAEVVIYDGDDVRIGTANFIVRVEAAPLNDDVEISETELPLLQQAITAAVDAAASADAAEDAADRAEAAAASGVTSFNGQTGDVIYTAPVTSVNNQTGAVTVEVPTKTSDLTNDSGFITSAPVTSVNGEVGDVELDIPTKTSDLQNDSGFITSAPVTSVNGMTGDVVIQAGGGGAVDSVNGKTGDVVLTASDVGALPTSTTIPSRTSQLVNDSGYITGYTETDPIFTASPAHGITSADITAWNAKSDFSGSYNDLTNKPTIPTKTSDLTNDSGFLTSAVTSFNGQTGAVTYTAPVTSVDGQTGAVTGLQTSAITDAGGYFTTDTVEAALQQIGSELDGVETLLAAI